LPNVPTAAPGRTSTAAWMCAGDLTSLSVVFFLFALAVIIHIKPLEYVSFNIFGLDISDMYHMLVSAAIAGVCFSLIGLALVLTTTPVPSYLGGIAAERAKPLKSGCPSRSSRCVRGKHFPRYKFQGLPHAEALCYWTMEKFAAGSFPGLPPRQARPRASSTPIPSPVRVGLRRCSQQQIAAGQSEEISGDHAANAAGR